MQAACACQVARPGRSANRCSRACTTRSHIAAIHGRVTPDGASPAQRSSSAPGQRPCELRRRPQASSERQRTRRGHERCVAAPLELEAVSASAPMWRLPKSAPGQYLSLQSTTCRCAPRRSLARGWSSEGGAGVACRRGACGDSPGQAVLRGDEAVQDGGSAGVQNSDFKRARTRTRCVGACPPTTAQLPAQHTHHMAWHGAIVDKRAQLLHACPVGAAKDAQAVRSRRHFNAVTVCPAPGHQACAARCRICR